MNGIALFFASGTAPLNRAALDQFATHFSHLALIVVAEFKPHCGEWIPFHVQRPLRENLGAAKAQIGDRPVAHAALVFARGTALGKMRLAAAALGGPALIAYDEELREVRWHSMPAFVLRSARNGIRRQFGEGGRGRQWLRRLARPSEAEIPVRARWAQSYGAIAAWFRAAGVDAPLRGEETLCDGVTVLIPSRDGRLLLEEMLPCLVSQLTLGEIVVVDNGSGDGTKEWMEREYPEIRVMSSETPLSFARAINTALVKARCKRVLLLNNDMIAGAGFVRELELAFERVPDLFCATAQIFFPNGRRREETGKAVWRQDSQLDFPVRCDLPVAGEDLTWVLYGSGGCSLFDTRRLLELGGVSEAYDPAYVEDLDYGFRAWKRGWPSVYCAGAAAEHRHRATTSRFFTSRQLQFFVERNYLLFLTRAVGSVTLFQSMWLGAIRRLKLRAMEGDQSALEALRAVPQMGPRPEPATGPLTEEEILALGSGDIAVFPQSRAVHATRQTVVIASPYLPFPLAHGGAVRIFNLMREASLSFDLVLVAFCNDLAAPPAELAALCREVILVRRDRTHYKKNTSRPDMVEEFDSLVFRACLRQTCERWKPTVVQLEFTWMAQYASACGSAKTILVEHDITFDLQRQMLAAGSAHTWELTRQFERWERFEKRAWGEVDCVVTMSSKDAAAVTGAKRSVELPNGVDCERFEARTCAAEPRRLLFIGSFAHLPNLLALEFFLREVWPLLPHGYTLHVIAGGRHEYYLDFYRDRVAVDLRRDGVEVQGFVSDVRDAYEHAELVIAPLVASAGTNIKVLEAMAMAKVVVSTPAGVNGIPVEHGKNAVVAEDPRDLALEIESLSRNADRRRCIGANARAFALRFDWKEVGKEQARVYRDLA